jgi:MFS family permease
MGIGVNLSALREIRWYEYAIRILFGGSITVIAGLIADHFGPTVGGLFLAFPAIFPASVTLIARHQRERKEAKGLHGAERGKQAAALEAMGAAMGSIGLLLFAMLACIFFQKTPAWATLMLATSVWLLASGLIWVLRKRRLRFRAMTR